MVSFLQIMKERFRQISSLFQRNYMEEDFIFLEPLAKVLINHGFCSLRSAGNFLRKNLVLVDGARIFECAFPVKIDENEISVNGNALKKQKHLYILMNKPAGYVCSYASDSHPVVYELISSINIPENLGKIHTVGRLDCDTSGLLLFTTNGSFSHKLASPDFKVEKKYFARLEFPVEESMQNVCIKMFREGVFLPAEKKFAGRKALPASLEFLGKTECVVSVREGQFHQIKRMFAAVQNKVVFLERIQFGGLKMDGNLLPGQFRFLEKEELRRIF